MKRVVLVRRADAEAAERSAALRRAGYDVAVEPFDGPAALKRLGARPPAAVVVDLTRAPSHGRDAALAIRAAKATRRVPLVLAGGEAEVVEKARAVLPDAVFTGWGGVKGALRRAIARPPERVAAPSSLLAGYSGTPLPKKLGIRPGSEVALLGAPEGFERALGDLPDGAVLTRKPRERADLVLWFVRSRAELASGIRRVSSLAGRGGVWIVWPKKASGVVSDLREAVVREIGLASGLVDYKICSVDPTWSGLRFARRASRRGG